LGKITILHKIASGSKDGKIPNRYSRHYYDIYRLANSEIKIRAFERKDLLEQVVKFVSKFYYTKGASYETAKIGSIKLVPSEETISILKKDYEQMKNIFFGEIPLFDEILETLKNLEKEINNLK